MSSRVVRGEGSELCQGFFQGFEVAVGCGPAGDEAAEGAIVVEGFFALLRRRRSPGLEEDAWQKGLHLLVCELDELLVGAGVAKGYACFREELSQLHCHVDGVSGDVEVKVVGEECIELNASESALGEQCAMTLHDVHEVTGCTGPWEDDCFAAKCADLCAADVEDVAVTGEPGEVEVALGGCQSVAQTCAVDEEVELVARAYIIYICYLFGGIDCAEFCGEGDIDQPGYDHVFERRVGMEGLEPGFELFAVELAAVRG